MTEAERYLMYIRQITADWNKLVGECGRLAQENRELRKKLTAAAKGGIIEERSKTNYIQLDNGRMAGSYSEGGGPTGENKSVDKSVESGIIESEKGIDKENDGMIKLSSKFVNSNEQLYINADKIKPIDGYDDVVSHGSPEELIINGNNGEEWTYNAKEAADMIRNSADYHNRPVRLVACQTGAGENCIAQQIANELGVEVLAPTEVVNINIDGEMFLCDNEPLSVIWNLSTPDERARMEEPGQWKTFKPQRKE